MPEAQKFHLRYALTSRSGEFTAEDIRAAGEGGCDALVLLSILYPPDGTYSLKPMSLDGRLPGATPLDPRELFKAWLMLGAALERDPDLDDVRRSIAGGPLRIFGGR